MGCKFFRGDDIPCRGKFSWLYAGEAAPAFIAAVSHDGTGSQVFNLNGPCVEIEKVIGRLKGIVPDTQITCSGDEFPMPVKLDDTPIQAALPS